MFAQDLFDPLSMNGMKKKIQERMFNLACDEKKEEKETPTSALIVHPSKKSDFTKAVSVDKFVSQSELNFLNFVNALFVSDVGSNKARLEDLKKNREQFKELKAEVDANRVFDEDKSDSGITFVFLKSCILNNLFTLCFGFEFTFAEQESFATPVKMEKFQKLKRVVELLFEINLLSPSSYSIHQSISYEVSRLEDLYFKKKREHFFADDDELFAGSLLEEPALNTIDYARTQYVEYLITSGLVDYTSCTIVCPNIFHLMISRSPSGMLYFKPHFFVITEYLLCSSQHGDGASVAITYMNVFFLCIHKHRIGLLKLLLRQDFKNSKRLKRPLVFEIGTKYSLRFDHFRGKQSNPHVEAEVYGTQDMTLLSFALRSGYTPPMMNILIGKIIEAYREVRGHYDADEDIKLKLMSMILDHTVNVFFELFFATVTAIPLFPQDPRSWPDLFKNLIPTVSHFDSIFFLNTLRLGPLQFEKFSIFDVMAFAAFDDHNLGEYKPPDEPFVHFSPFFLPFVYVKLIYNVSIYGIKKSATFLTCFAENYLPGFFQVLTIYIQKLMDNGFDKSDFMEASQMMIKILEIQSRKEGRDPKVIEQFNDFFWYWILKEEMERSDKLEEEQKRVEIRNEKYEGDCMCDEDLLSKKMEAAALLQEKRNLEILRKKQLQEENDRKALLKKQQLSDLKAAKEMEIQACRDTVTKVLLLDSEFTATEQKNYLKKVDTKNMDEIIREIEKKREDRIQKRLLLKEKEEARLLLKEQESAAKSEYETMLYPTFLDVVVQHKLDNNIHVKNIIVSHSRHSMKFIEKAQLVTHFLSVLLPEIVGNIRALQQEEHAAAADAMVAAEEALQFLNSPRFQDQVKSLTFGQVNSVGLTNIVLPNQFAVKMEDYEDVFREAFGASSSDIKAVYLQILDSPNINSVTRHLVPYFQYNIANFKEQEKGEAVFLQEFVGKLIVIFSFLSSASVKNGIHLVLKGSTAINYYASMDSMDMDFSFFSLKPECTISFFERLSVSVCVFIQDLFASFYSNKTSFTIEHGSFKDSNNYCCTLKLSLIHVITKINCAYFNRHTNKVAGLSLVDFNFGVAQNNRFRETKYSIVFNKETGSLVKVDKANRERNASKTNLLHGSLFLPTLDALIEERLYYLVIYSREKESIDFDKLETEIQTKRDPTLFYIHKTMKQLATLLRSRENPLDSLKDSYCSVQRQETGFPDFEMVPVFHHIF